MADPLTIGDVAREAGVNRETLRYYERRGLVLPSARSESGYRLYPSSATKVVRFIKRAQSLGFSLEEVEELLSLRQNTDRTCEQVKMVALTRLTDIESKISQLQSVQEQLSVLIGACGSGGAAPDCPILESLDDNSGLA